MLKLSLVAHTRNPSIQEVKQADPKFQASPGYLVSGAEWGEGRTSKINENEKHFVDPFDSLGMDQTCAPLHMASLSPIRFIQESHTQSILTWSRQGIKLAKRSIQLLLVFRLALNVTAFRK